MQNDDAIILASLPMPDEAGAYLEALKTGRRPQTCANMVGVTRTMVKNWREMSAAYDEMCFDAETTGTGRIDDIGLSHVEAGTPGWASAWKTIMQQRDPSYSDKVQQENSDTVKLIHVVDEAPVTPDDESVEVPS